MHSVTTYCYVCLHSCEYVHVHYVCGNFDRCIICEGKIWICIVCNFVQHLKVCDFCFALQSTPVPVFQWRSHLVYIYGIHHQPTDWRHSWSMHTCYSDSTSIAAATAGGTDTQPRKSQWEFWPTAKACILYSSLVLLVCSSWWRLKHSSSNCL